MARPKGSVEIKVDRCKGCGLCVASCPTKSLKMGTTFNRLGYHAAVFCEGTGCTGCGLCFYACPEPDAVVVFKEKEGPAA
jgi:Pyruvate/2-oxoacid:ferredoxin oxidoreductase delta subunit